MNKERITWISTTKEKQWKKGVISEQEIGDDTLELTGESFQSVDGFGGCFNEIEWKALSWLPDDVREKIILELFDTEKGCRFNLCRLPIGANDYALKWYSYDEHEGDYGMEKFSIERDKEYIIPFIKSAFRYNKNIKLFASPWSPPTWMKYPSAFNHGTLVWEDEILKAYALYFVRFVQEYQKEGIEINQVHVQNEPMSDQKFPSCVWKGEQFREFIKDYLGPAFESNDIKAEIWLGTLNGPEVDERFLHTGYDDYANLVLSDKVARKYIRGVSYQWCGKNAIQQTYMSWSDIKLMQSENECGDGSNTWEYARYVFNLMRHYFTNGAGSYIYWNMVLPPEGVSTWGWKQNSMITVLPDTGEVIYNPEFYLMKHYSHFVEIGAKRLGIKGRYAGSSVAFRNPSGEIVLIVGNGLSRDRQFIWKDKDNSFSVILKANSYNTFVIHS